MADATYTMAPNPHPSSRLSRQQHQHELFPASNNASTSPITATTDDNSRMMALDDSLNVARSLLGISPCSVADSSMATPTFGGRVVTKLSRFAATTTTAAMNHVPPSFNQVKSSDASADAKVSATFRPRSNSAGLEALAFLATQRSELETEESSGSPSTGTIGKHRTGCFPIQISSNQQPRLVPLLHQAVLPDSIASAQPVLIPQQYHHQHQHAVISSSSDDDGSDAMPPPPPRRRRSISNPEGMEKYNNNPFRLSLVLPAAILEEELAEASAAIKAKEEENEAGAEQEDEDYEEEEGENNVDAAVDQGELLRRARSRLLEDLSQGNLIGEKGVLILPHSMNKYKEVCFLYIQRQCCDVEEDTDI
jgi:hypothetical protein